MWLGATSVLLVHWSSVEDFWQLVLPQPAQDFSIPFFYIPLTTIGLASDEPDEVASAEGMVSFLRTFGGAIGVSVGTTMWCDQAAFARSEMVGSLTTGDARVVGEGAGFSLDQSMQAIAELVDGEALALTTIYLFLIGAITFVASATIIWIVPRPRRPPDLLLANVGINAKGPLEAMEWDSVRAVVEINTLGTIGMAQAALPLLSATPGSLLLATALTSAIFGQAGMAVYSANKRDVRWLIEAPSVEPAPVGVPAADPIPGIIDTGMLAPEHRPVLPAESPFRVMPAEAAADAAWDAYRGAGLRHHVPAELHEVDVAAIGDPERGRYDRTAGLFARAINRVAHDGRI